MFKNFFNSIYFFQNKTGLPGERGPKGNLGMKGGSGLPGR